MLHEKTGHIPSGFPQGYWARWKFDWLTKNEAPACSKQGASTHHFLPVTPSRRPLLAQTFVSPPHQLSRDSSRVITLIPADSGVGSGIRDHL
ncbi:hypothetical protein VTN96DRAFT_2695 [Rasamsonia emersonii]